MDNNRDIQDELAGMDSMLAQASRAMPYVVPENYFSGFAAKVSQHIAGGGDYEAARDWGKKMPYSVPEGYFEALPRAISNTMAFVDKKDVPEGYFDKLPERMLQAAKAADRPRRAIPFPATVFTQLRWVAAAVLIICISLGGYMAFDGQGDASPENILSSISQSEIQEYLQSTDRVDDERIVNNTISNLPIGNDEIISYLDETGWE
jgi:hypothetical protein